MFSAYNKTDNVYYDKPRVINDPNRLLNDDFDKDQYLCRILSPGATVYRLLTTKLPLSHIT